MPSETPDIHGTVAEKVLWLLLRDMGPVKIRSRRLEDDFNGCHLRMERVDNEFTMVTARGFDD